MKRNLQQRLEMINSLLYTASVEMKALRYESVDLSESLAQFVKLAESELDTIGFRIKGIRSEIVQEQPKHNKLVRMFLP